MIIIDIKGDIARATARFRRELGQTVHILDPFGVTGASQSTLDGLAIFDLPDIEIESESETITATLFQDQRAATKDPFWVIQGASLISSIIAHLVRRSGSPRATMNDVIDILFHEDTVYHLAVLMDTVVEKGSYEAAGIASFLALPDVTRGGVLSTAQSALARFRSKAVRDSMGTSTVSLVDLIHNVPTTIYLVLPLTRLQSHGVLLALWLESLLQALLRRTKQCEPATLAVIDEAAQLGMQNSIRTVSTFLRGSGVRMWTLWQDGSQLSTLYPDWQTIVNNTSVRTFMPGSAGLASEQLAAMAGVSQRDLMSLNPFEQLVCESGREPRIVRIPRYWIDRRFRGRFDDLPRHNATPLRTVPEK